MTPGQRQNLRRLLKPKHVAIIGGRDAEVVINELKRSGYSGAIWPVNPKRETLGGFRCYSDVTELPERPDGSFLAIPGASAIDVIGQLKSTGAGGVVCYTAGFGEAGENGEAAQQALIKAAGDLALIGPNCYGMINYLDHVALWPFAHGGSCPGFGAAIITQSGMLSSDLTMSQRSLPLTHMISAGNQAVLQLEDFVDVLCEQKEVRAIGIHIEGLRDVQRFCEVALKALSLGKPIVALKTGSSKVGQSLTVSHTGSLSGSDDLYQALFERLGIIRVTNPAQMLETLKFICVSGIPKGNRVIGFTCSGGGATMLADHGEKIGLEFPQPRESTTMKLTELLPDIATVSNPLDYTTPIWGDPEKVPPVFETACGDGYDAAIILQDYPLPGLDESRWCYFNDSKSFVKATRDAKLPAAVCSTLPENLDEEARTYLVGKGVTPSQGIHEALEAIRAAVWYGERRAKILNDKPEALVTTAVHEKLTVLDEASGKEILKSAGLPIPDGRVIDRDNAALTADEIGYPLSLKMVSANLPHKSEAGAVRLNLLSSEAVTQAIDEMHRNVMDYDKDAVTDKYLIEPMIDDVVAELMVNIRSDPQFGLAMTLASGGTLVELVEDANTILLPASDYAILESLECLKICKLLDGYRGKPSANKTKIVQALQHLANYVAKQRKEIAEIEINPLLILSDEVCAIDVLIQVQQDC